MAKHNILNKNIKEFNLLLIDSNMKIIHYLSNWSEFNMSITNNTVIVAIHVVRTCLFKKSITNRFIM